MIFDEMMVVGMPKAMRLSFGCRPVFFKFMAFSDKYPDIIDSSVLIEETDNTDLNYPVLRHYVRRLTEGPSRLAGIEVSIAESRDKRPQLDLLQLTEQLVHQHSGPSSFKISI